MNKSTLTPPEIDALFCALRQPPRAEELTSKLEALSEVEWRSLASQAIDLHRVGPRFWHTAKSIVSQAAPTDAVQRFKQDARQSAVRALTLKTESAKVIAAFNRIGVEPCVLKGWPLAEEVGQSIGHRVMRDIDLLIDGADMVRAFDRLQELGYHCQLDRAFMSRPGLDNYLRFSHHIVFVKPDSDLMVELHARPLRNPHLLPVEELQTKRITLALGHDTLRYRVPEKPNNFVYLALHGYSHAWARAKWLLDIAPLIAVLSPADWRNVQEQSCRLGVERTVGVALVLAQDILHLPIPEPARTLALKARNTHAAAACQRYLLATDGSASGATLRRWLEFHLVSFSTSARWPVVVRSIESLVVRERDILASDLAHRFPLLQYANAVLHLPWRILSHLPWRPFASAR